MRETEDATSGMWPSVKSDCIRCPNEMGTRDSRAITGVRHRFHLKEQGRRDGAQGLLPIRSPQYSITVKLNLRMTDAANQRRVSEVKLRSIR